MKRLYMLLLFLSIVFFTFTLGAAENFDKTSLKDENLKLPYSNQYYNQETSHDSNVDAKTMDKISEGPIRKLGRGISNIVFGVFEVLIQPYKVNETDGGIAACSYGLVKGIFYFIARECVGVVDVITFPMPLPGAAASGFKGDWGYGPLMQPEWVFDIEDNPYNFIYQDNPL